jgi:outer membrane lipoprotein-sorting protein
VPQAAALNAQDGADVQRIEAYLNSIVTLQSRFQQVSGEGGVAQGTIWVERPGRMRIVYDPPVTVVIVATQGQVYYYDSSLQQVSRTTVDETPAWFLLRPKITLGGEITLTKFAREASVLRATLVETAHPDIGQVTVALSDQPLALRQWTVLDAQRKTVTVTLTDPQFGGQLNPNLFYWTDPRPGASAVPG